MSWKEDTVRCVGAALSIAIACNLVPLAAANQTAGAVGWVMNTGETQWLGFWIAAAGKHHGVYFDYKFSSDPSGDGDYYGNISVNKAENIFRDELRGTERSAETWDLAYIFRFGRAAALYAGAGVTSFKHFREYYDRYEILGSHGQYFISDPSKDHKEVSFLGGLVFGLTPNITAVLGYQSQPAGVNLGVGYANGWIPKKRGAN